MTRPDSQSLVLMYQGSDDGSGFDTYEHQSCGHHVLHAHITFRLSRIGAAADGAEHWQL